MWLDVLKDMKKKSGKTVDKINCVQYNFKQQIKKHAYINIERNSGGKKWVFMIIP